MINAQVLILGLALFCVEGSDVEGGNCNIPVNNPRDPKPQARVFFVNATKQYCRTESCTACGEKGIQHHYPVLLYKCQDFKAVNLKSCEKNSDVCCWDVTATKLCVSTPKKNKFQTLKGRPENDTYPGLGKFNKQAFGWVGSIDYFKKTNVKLTFYDHDALTPKKKGRVIATLDFHDAGVLRTGRHGRGEKKGLSTPYTVWKPAGNQERQPPYTSLADAVVWDLDDVKSFAIYNCANNGGQNDQVLEFHEGEPRVIVANLPKSAWSTDSDRHKGKDNLYHYLMYFNLFTNGGDVCGYPTRASTTKSFLWAFDVPYWLEKGKFKRRMGYDFTASETALCPPTKFP